MKDNKVLVFYENDSKPIEYVANVLGDPNKLLKVKVTRKEYLGREKVNTGEKYVFLRVGDSIRAQVYIGFTFIDGKEVIVLPKIARSANTSYNKDLYDAISLMLTMISYALSKEIAQYSEAVSEFKKKYSSEEIGFYDLLVFVYARILLKELYRGAYNSYKYIVSEEKRVKGKIILSKQLLKPPHKQLNLSIKYARYGVNNLLNNIFFYASVYALKCTKHYVNRRLLREILYLLNEAYVETIGLTDLGRIVFTRNNSRFKPAFTLARIILEGLRSLTPKEKIHGFFIDSSLIFEKIILNTLHNLKKYTIRYQEELREEAKSLVPNYSLKMIPDITIVENKEAKLLIDAKYKQLSIGGTGNNDIKIANEDIYQAYTYMRALQLHNKGKDNKEKPEGKKIVLVYPKYKEFNKNLKQKTIEFKDGNKIILLPYTIKSPEIIIDKEFPEKIQEILSEK